jgi:hypothetical protein
MDNFTKEVHDRIYTELGPIFGMWTVDNHLENFIKDKNPQAVIEIGRCNGISTLIMAKYAKIVFSFDVASHNNELIWSLYPELRKKIYSWTGPQNVLDFTIQEIKDWRKPWGLDFNFAFIDGEHSYEAVKHDYDLVKFCNRVLFHDVHGYEVGKFVLKELGGSVTDENGYYGYYENGGQL